MSDMMRVMAAVADGFEQVEVARPSPGPGEVRVAVVASAINAADLKVIGGEFAGRFLHAKTSPLYAGYDFAGTVDALGDGVSELEVGAQVWGHLAYAGKQRQGAFAEFLTIATDAVATRPTGVAVEVAAASPTVALTSLQSLRDLGGLKQGGKALIIGAGGGVGAIAVGVAKRLGAHVTGVCSTKDVERVAALGADVVIDRKESDLFAGAATYNVVFDTPAVHSFGRCTKLLRAGGAYVTTLPGAALLTGKLRALFSSKSCHFVTVVSKRADLELLGGWLSDGLELPIDSRHKIADLAAAVRRQTERDRVGRVVVDVEDGWA